MKVLLAAGALLLCACAHQGVPVPASRIKVITLAVSDLDASLKFYRDGLGFPTQGIIGQEFDYGAVVFFTMPNGLILACWPAASLAHDSGVSVTRERLGAVSIGYIVPTTADVDAMMDKAAHAGATITMPAAKRFWGGYSGYFHDPDGHVWEVAWHPEWSVKE